MSCFLFTGMSGSFAVRGTALYTHLLRYNIINDSDRDLYNNTVNKDEDAGNRSWEKVACSDIAISDSTVAGPDDRR